MKTKGLNRVDIQVSILTIAIVIVSCGLIYSLNYSLSYWDMIKSLQERIAGIHTYLDNKLSEESFLQLNTIEDEQKQIYKDSKALLESVKNSTGVRYLYTAKVAQDGKFIYVVDGLDRNSGDFRNVGDPIEPEIIADMQRALDGESVLPDEIKATSWGKIFISYLPIHDGNEVIGVLGIEFDAEHQYHTYQLLKFVTPGVIFLFCIISAGIAVMLFRRISNPTFQDMASSDILTGLKNRNAFETDMGNLNRRGNKEHLAFLSLDLDNLKLVNDNYGHAEGDDYIRLGSRVVRDLIQPPHVMYRIGGDEFVVVFRGSKKEEIEQIIHILEERLSSLSTAGSHIPICISYGYALYQAELDENDLFHTVKRADQAMYQQKREKKKDCEK